MRLLWSILCLAPLAASPLHEVAFDMWEPEPYRLKVLHQTPLADDFNDELAKLQASLGGTSSPVNLEVEVIDLSESDANSMTRDLSSIHYWPAMVLETPAGSARPRLVFGASKEKLLQVIDSPTRQRMAEHLKNGMAGVWCLIHSGDATADMQAHEQLFQTLEETHVRYPDANFAIETITRDDPAEQPLIRMLVKKKEAAPYQPLVFAVYGRGRMIGPLPATRTSEIAAICQLLCDPVQSRDRPGRDLLIASDWVKITTIEAPQPSPEPQKSASETPKPVVSHETEQVPPTDTRKPLPRWRIIGIVLSLLLGGVTILFISRSGS